MLIRHCAEYFVIMDYTFFLILALKVILLDRLQGIICSGIQEPYLLGVML